MIIRNIYEATQQFVNYIHYRNRQLMSEGWRYEIKRIFEENNGKHRLFILDLYYRNKLMATHKVYLIYVRNWFMQFSKYFNVDSMGTSIRLDILERLVKSGVQYIAFVHRSDGIYFIKTEKFYNLALENNWIRTPEATGEKLANIPITYLTHIYPKTGGNI